MTDSRRARWLAIIMAAAFAVLAAIGVATPAAAQGCPAERDCLVAGDYNLSLVHQGKKREYLLHVPASYTGATPAALVVDIHGWTGTAAGHRAISGQLEQSERRGAIVAWPEGLDKSWNGYRCCGNSLIRNVDDVGFIRAMVGAIMARSRIDPARVYATGLSNGASMSMRLGCEAADLFNGVAAVSQMLNEPARCRPSRPISVTSFHGVFDPLAPYWGSILGFQSARASFASWAKINRCNAVLDRRQLTGISRIETFNTCADGVQVGLVTLGSGAHVIYDTPEKFDIAEYIWTHVFR